MTVSPYSQITCISLAGELALEGGRECRIQNAVGRHSHRNQRTEGLPRHRSDAARPWRGPRRSRSVGKYAYILYAYIIVISLIYFMDFYLDTITRHESYLPLRRPADECAPSGGAWAVHRNHSRSARSRHRRRCSGRESNHLLLIVIPLAL